MTRSSSLAATATNAHAWLGETGDGLAGPPEIRTLPEARGKIGQLYGGLRNFYESFTRPADTRGAQSCRLMPGRTRAAM